jgi:hypothetical protein
MRFQFSNPSLIRSSSKLNQSETRIGHERHACWLICTKITPFGYDITSSKNYKKVPSENLLRLTSVMKRITGSVYDRLIKTQRKSIDLFLFLAHLTQRVTRNIDMTSRVQKITRKFQAKIYCALRAFPLIKTHQRRSGRKVRNTK